LILLARHGETDDNRPPARVQGQGRDTPINAAGRDQARALAEAVAGEGVRALYCSQLHRSRETAEIVGRALALDPIVDERFAETARGSWEGRTWEDIEAAEPRAFRRWRTRPSRFRFPGGESLKEQMDRVVAALVDVTQRGVLPALVVCHGGTIRTALCHTDNRGLDAFHDWDVPNGALVRL
jgi:broad specificity phosphatase PhoE